MVYAPATTEATVKKRRVLRKLVIDEVSLVDNPACEAAKVVIFKRASGVGAGLEARLEQRSAAIADLAKRAEAFAERCGVRKETIVEKTAFEELDELAESFVEKSGYRLDRAEALRRAISKRPDLYIRHRREAPLCKVRTVAEEETIEVAKARPAEDALLAAARGIVSKSAGRVTLAEALAEVARMNPDAIAAYQREVEVRGKSTAGYDGPDAA